MGTKLSFSECLKNSRDESWKKRYLGALYDLNPERQYKYLWMLMEYEKLNDSCKSDFQFSVLCSWIYRHTYLDFINDFPQHRLVDEPKKRAVNSTCVLVMGEETIVQRILCVIGNTYTRTGILMNRGMRPPENMSFSEWFLSKDDAWKIQNLDKLDSINLETQQKYLKELADLIVRIRSYNPTNDFEDEFLDLAVHVFMEFVHKQYRNEFHMEYNKLHLTPLN